MSFEERPQTNEKDLPISLAAGVTQRFPRRGRYWHCLTISTDGVMQIGVGQPAENGRFLNSGMGSGEVSPPFDYLEFKNTSGGTVSATLQISDSPIIDNRLTLVGGAIPVLVQNATASPVPTLEASPSGITSGALTSLAATSNADVAANANSKLNAVYNDDTSLSLWIRDQSGTAIAGLPVGPKQTVFFTLTGAFRIRNPNGSAVNYSLTVFT